MEMATLLYRLAFWNATLALRAQHRKTETLISAHVITLILRSVAWPMVLATFTIVTLFAAENLLRAKSLWFPSTWRAAIVFQARGLCHFSGHDCAGHWCFTRPVLHSRKCSRECRVYESAQLCSNARRR